MKKLNGYLIGLYEFVTKSNIVCILWLIFPTWVRSSIQALTYKMTNFCHFALIAAQRKV